MYNPENDLILAKDHIRRNLLFVIPPVITFLNSTGATPLREEVMWFGQKKRVGSILQIIKDFQSYPRYSDFIFEDGWEDFFKLYRKRLWQDKKGGF